MVSLELPIFTPWDNIHVNNSEINVKNRKVPLIKWSENNWSVQSDLEDLIKLVNSIL